MLVLLAIGDIFHVAVPTDMCQALVGGFDLSVPHTWSRPDIGHGEKTSPFQSRHGWSLVLVERLTHARFYGH